MPLENTPFIISSIIHFYFTVESSVNCICDDMMYGENSPFYIKPETRSVELKRYFANWRSIGLDEKLNFIIERFNAQEISKDLVDELKEFGRLRNLIVHNKVYRPLYSQPEPNENPRLWEVEYETDSNKLFPKTRFNLPIELTISDLHKALLICLKLLIVLTEKCHFVLFYHLPSGDARTMGYVDKDKSVEENFKSILEQLETSPLL